MSNLLPQDTPWRKHLHNEIHARPSSQVQIPALIVYVAVLNAESSREQECQHLRKLPGQSELSIRDLQGNFLRLNCDTFEVQWERHTEFTRYSIVQGLPDSIKLGDTCPELLIDLKIGSDWLRSIPGSTITAIQLSLVHGELNDLNELIRQGKNWFGSSELVASQLGSSTNPLFGHSLAMTDFRIAVDGYQRLLVIAPPDTTVTRAGRIAQRLLDLETYRLMALCGLPIAKDIGPMLTASEAELAAITSRLESKDVSDQELLDTLVSLAARVEWATAQHSFRFSATNAYSALISQRIIELREKPIPGTQTIGEFLQRRLSPAMATVAATAQRLASLSERISRASSLLRTRVDIETENQNQLLLAKLTRGQELQLRLQSTVEGLSIAAISYYVISLLLYTVKAIKSAGAEVNPEVLVGAAIPLVLWAVWRTTRKIHRQLEH